MTDHNNSAIEPSEATPNSDIVPADKAGLPEHHPRMTDTDPAAAARAERQVALMFTLSAVLTVLFVVAFFAIPGDKYVSTGLFGQVSASNLALGVTFGLAMFFIGAGAIHWARKLMANEEVVQLRHSLSSTPESREAANSEFNRGVQESGFAQRKIIRRSLIGALALFPLPLVVLLRDLGPAPGNELRETLWKSDELILTDPSGLPLRPSDLPVGGLVSAMPASMDAVQHLQGTLDARAKNVIILVRMDPSEIVSQQGGSNEEPWDYQGILCFSKICTHVGCPIALYEQRTHHLLCPCHQSTFDLADSGNVVFGPAARRLPQLPIKVNDQGFLVARDGFAEPVGPSFWERG